MLWKYSRRCFWIAGLSLMLFRSALGSHFLELCEYVCVNACSAQVNVIKRVCRSPGLPSGRVEDCVL